MTPEPTEKPAVTNNQSEKNYDLDTIVEIYKKGLDGTMTYSEALILDDFLKNSET